MCCVCVKEKEGEANKIIRSTMHVHVCARLLLSMGREKGEGKEERERERPLFRKEVDTGGKTFCRGPTLCQ